MSTIGHARIAVALPSLGAHPNYLKALMRASEVPNVVSNRSAQSESEDDDMPDDLGAMTHVMPRPRTACPTWCNDHDADSGVHATSTRLTITDAGPAATAVRSADIHLTAENGAPPAIQLCFNDGGDHDMDLDEAEAFAAMILTAVKRGRTGGAL